MPDIKTIIEKITELVEPVSDLTKQLTVIRGAIATALIFLITKIASKKLKFNKDDGYYYDKKGKDPYCPRCYDVKKLKVHIINNKCPECDKIYRYPLPVAVSCPMPRYKIPNCYSSLGASSFPDSSSPDTANDILKKI